MTVEVTYNHGVFKPKQPIDLPEGTTGNVVLQDSASITPIAGEEWRDLEIVKARIRNIARMSKNTGDVEPVARNHDKYLYGNGHGA